MYLLYEVLIKQAYCYVLRRVSTVYASGERAFFCLKVHPINAIADVA